MLKVLRWVVASTLFASIAGCGSQSATVDDAAVDDANVTVAGYPVFNELAAAEIGKSDHLVAEEYIAECMKLNGHDSYELIKFRSPLPKSLVADIESDISDSMFAAKYGYGVATVQEKPVDPATLTEAEIAVLEEAANAESQDRMDGAESLSPKGQEKFWQSLYGESGDGGCVAEAPRAIDPSTYFAQIDEVDKARVFFADDINVDAHYAVWSECMNETGYPYRNPFQVLLELQGKLGPAMSGDASLENLAQFEIELGTATFACGEPTRLTMPKELRPVWEQYAPA